MDLEKSAKTLLKPKTPGHEHLAPNLTKARETKNRRNEHNAGKKRDIFKLQTKIVPGEPRPIHSRVAESLPTTPATRSFTHDGYIRHWPLRRSFEEGLIHIWQSAGKVNARTLLNVVQVLTVLTRSLGVASERSRAAESRDLQTRV